MIKQVKQLIVGGESWSHFAEYMSGADRELSGCRENLPKTVQRFLAAAHEDESRREVLHLVGGKEVIIKVWVA